MLRYMVLSTNDYDIRYFDGALADYQHNAGYARYQRWYRHEGSDSTGEYWCDWTTYLCTRFALSGKHVLEVGCAKGFVVEDLRSLGVEAWGVDVSEYAISCAAPVIRPFLVVADARSLPMFADREFDFLFTRGVLECFHDLDPVIAQFNRISKAQAHFTHTQPSPRFYVSRTLDELITFDWPTGTRLISIEQNEERVK